MNVGDKLPEVLGLDQNGQEITLSSLAGKKLVLYAYPKDNTSGCTAEACSLRDHYDELQQAGYVVIGVSKDSAASHQKFIDKYELPFPLLSDPDHSLLESLGAWGEKKNYGKVTVGTIRSTYIFDEDGICTEIIRKVDTKNHSAQILK